MAEFNPSEHTVAEVNEYLAGADEAEVERVLAAEAADKDRSTVAAPDPEAKSDPEAAPEVVTASNLPALHPDVNVPAARPVLSSVVDTEHEFAATEENSILLLAGAAAIGADPSVVTTKNGKLQAPESVVVAAFPTEKEG